MGLYVSATDKGLQIEVTNEDYFGTSEIEVLPWDDIAKHLAPIINSTAHIAGMREAAAVTHDPRYGADWQGMRCAILDRVAEMEVGQ